MRDVVIPLVLTSPSVYVRFSGLVGLGLVAGGVRGGTEEDAEVVKLVVGVLEKMSFCGTIETQDFYGRPPKFQLGSCGLTTMGAILGTNNHLFYFILFYFILFMLNPYFLPPFFIRSLPCC